MKPERYQQVKEIFAAAAGHGPDSRGEVLARACAGDPELRAEVESLLTHDESAGGFIEESAFEVAARMTANGESSQPERHRIGAYRILREVGRGGMGVVYLADRDDERFRQRVAIKVVKRGLDTDDILRRFRNERQILASLRHPNIAKVFDGGETADGLPYFVMEYVEGLPLLQYCDENGLSVDDRLKIFDTICSAVAHAHRNLVIHRDLKPSNVLVTHDGEVKLLDFGVAKLLNPELTGGGMTQTVALRVLTPEYASPEQVRGAHVTTATDIYSLGVVLYELLAGARPYELKDSSPEELSRVICDSEPSKPSDAASRRVSVDRGSADSKAISARLPSAICNPKALRGDLDNIILMAMRKEPVRRYKSVEQFSEDVRRHLAGLPVVARKDTFSYRTSKWIQRNKAASAAAVLIALTLVGGIVTTSWQAQRARAQARLAEAKSREAQAALAKTEKINRFMQTIFSYANSDWFGRAGGRRDMSVLEAMRDIEKHIDEDFRDDPDLRADVYQQIGDSYRTQLLFEDAERNLRQALSLRLQLYGEDNVKVAESMFILSGVRSSQGDFAEQERLLTKALSIQRRHPDEGNNLPYMITDYAGFLHGQRNDFAGALALDREALAEFRRRYDNSHFMIGLTQSLLVRDLTSLGDYAQAETIIPIVQEQFKQKPHLSGTLECYAFIKTFRGDYQAAENAIRELSVLAQRQDAKPYMKPDVLNAQSFLAYRRGDYAQAKVYAEKALATAQASGLAYYYSNIYRLAPSLNGLGQTKRAETLLLKEIEQLKQSERVVELARVKSVLGESLTAQRRFAEAETVLLEAYETLKARVLPQQYDLIETRRRLAELYRAWGKGDEAKKYE